MRRGSRSELALASKRSGASGHWALWEPMTSVACARAWAVGCDECGRCGLLFFRLFLVRGERDKLLVVLLPLTGRHISGTESSEFD